LLKELKNKIQPFLLVFFLILNNHIKQHLVIPQRNSINKFKNELHEHLFSPNITIYAIGSIFLQGSSLLQKEFFIHCLSEKATIQTNNELTLQNFRYFEIDL